METNLFYCTRTGRTTTEKTMEDGNVADTNDDKLNANLVSLYCQGKLTTNGHDSTGEPSRYDKSYETRRPSSETVQDDKNRKRINPLRIHIGERSFVENSIPHNCPPKKRKLLDKPNEANVPKESIPRVPKLIPKRIDHQFHNVKLHIDSTLDNEQDKPTPRLVPKSQALHFKNGKVGKKTQLKEYAQSLGLQPKLRCSTCNSKSFASVDMLKEHHKTCHVRIKKAGIRPETAPSPKNDSGLSGIPNKVYLCSACRKYYENWDLFLHMRGVHNRHICLFCMGMFSTAEKLWAHLFNKHNVQEHSYTSKEEFRNIYNGSFYVMCCVCDEICSEKEDFYNHDCNNVKPKPVPVLVSKSSTKSNVKLSKNIQERTSNGPGLKDVKPLCDKKETIEPKIEKLPLQSRNVFSIKNNCESKHINTSINSINSSTIVSNITSNTVDEPESFKCTSPKQSTSQKRETPEILPNGEDCLKQCDDINYDKGKQLPVPIKPKVESPRPLVDKEKEGGIKLKLSLNNANSPVIINSTVDPTVGQHYAHKPPSRNRRPPKRYEKEKPPQQLPHQPPQQPPYQPPQQLPYQPPHQPTQQPMQQPVQQPPHVRQPSIKMTICDRADSPFVKTTIFENNKETVVKTLINNNVESSSVKGSEIKPENAIKTTIYDVNFDNSNTLNRVPKLTVRVPKEFLDKSSSSDYSSDSDVSDKLTVDDNNVAAAVKQEDHIEADTLPESTLSSLAESVNETAEETKTDQEAAEHEQDYQDNQDADHPVPEIKSELADVDVTGDISFEEPSTGSSIPVTELTLERPLDKYPLKDLLKVFLSSTFINCIYCNHARVIAVNCEQLALHMVAEHRFSATVDSITAEELMPETITNKLSFGAEELHSVYINLDSYDSIDKYDLVSLNQQFECFQCFFKTTVHKDLYVHNRKMHQKTILLCVMCKNNFYSYSELICHLCPGTYDSEYEMKYRCCYCTVDTISSTFRLMVHLRKIHNTCDVCLEFCQTQARLSNHVWKHKLHHLCYRCGIAYRNKPDINNHLFWKHGTESVLCKRCLQKKWPHVYHFCIPPPIFVCDECAMKFSKAVYLKVHKRLHSSEYPHTCIEEGCTEKFISKKLLGKHLDEHKKKTSVEDFNEENPSHSPSAFSDKQKTQYNDVDSEKPREESRTSEVKVEAEQLSKKYKKKKKDKDDLLLDVNLPELNLSESDSSDESDSGHPPAIKEVHQNDKGECNVISNEDKIGDNAQLEVPSTKIEDIIEPETDKCSELVALDIWNNFKKYQAEVKPKKEKTPPLILVCKHVCESDHDYCIIPPEVNGDDEIHSYDKKKSKKSPRKKHGDLSSSSSSSSDSDSSCSCGSNCSCSSSSGSSSSSSSDSDSSDESGVEKKKIKTPRKALSNRRISNGSNVDVMGMSETPVLVPEKLQPLIAESDLETDESDTDEEFYDENPQQVTNKMHSEKRNQLMLLASVAPSEGGSISADISRCSTPIKEEESKATDLLKIEQGIKQEDLNEIKPEDESELKEQEIKPEDIPKEKIGSSKKKSKKKKKSKSSKKHSPIKLNIPKDVIRPKLEVEETPRLAPNKITISLLSNKVQIPDPPKTAPPSKTSSSISTGNKRASKRRRVPNKFYGYSSDEEPSTHSQSTHTVAALKPQLPPKLEWRKEDLPTPVTHKSKKEMPSIIPQRLFNYNEPIRLKTPIPDPEPPRILMNTESMESSDSDSSEEGALQILQPGSLQNSISVPPPTYLNSGTSSLPYVFQRPAAREAREGESVYCYCRCPYDEVSEMIACDAEGCPIEWFHFECVGIMVPPKGKWYCPECRKNTSFTGYR